MRYCHSSDPAKIKDPFFKELRLGKVEDFKTAEGNRILGVKYWLCAEMGILGIKEIFGPNIFIAETASDDIVRWIERGWVYLMVNG